MLCSPGHAVMNAGFVWFGLTLALGGYLLAAPGRWLWVVAGLGSIGVGLVPVVESPGLHGLVALPVFVAQPIAVAVMAHRLRTESDARWRIAAGAAVVSIVGAVVFTAFVLLDVATAKGAFERAALWPAYLWVSCYAVTTIRRR